MKKTFILALLSCSMLCSAAEADRAQKLIYRNTDGDVLQPNQWGYMPGLVDGTADLITRAGAGDATGVPYAKNEWKEPVITYYEDEEKTIPTTEVTEFYTKTFTGTAHTIANELTTSGNTQYSLYFETNSAVTMTVGDSVNLFQINPGSTHPTTYTFNLGSTGSITTASHANFGSGTTSLTLNADLSAADLEIFADCRDETVTASRTLISAQGDYGIWNLGTKSDNYVVTVTSSALNELGFTYAGCVNSVNDLAMGTYGYVFSDGTSDSITLVARAMPEPATATLSLLALAGLAARRRRH